MTTSSSSGLRS
uniref:BMA-CCR-4, isoform k n=1 Tax=Brugia malayi TaxID=6279 RepID=A0A1I9G1Y1_BRUMA|nr:BMA-CCR-4, isoform k [Brugia malayi]